MTTVALALPSTVAHAEPTRAELEKQLDQISGQLGPVVEQYNKVREELAASKATVAALNAELAPLREQLTAAEARIGAVAAAAYRGGYASTATMILSSESPLVLVDQLTLLEAMAADQRRDLAAVTAAKTPLDARKADLDTILNRQVAQEQELAGKKTQIETDLKRVRDLRTRLYGAASQPAGRYTGPPPPYVAGKAGVAVRYAYDQIGKPYQWATAGPNGFDCSGLVLASWRAAGTTLRHNTVMQYNDLPHVGKADLKPGDVVFFYADLHHNGLYIGDNKIIHAPTFGQTIAIVSLDSFPWAGAARPS
ncbi:NlpC/P60 family protein [Longispora sp. NPDC051575]|uniref:C40 family peptidase n=1 Tax=Longispora sp. NPDC051575 TaxID=3154943 RepID=UPI003423FF6D